jgi:hypothetical protein
VKNQPIVAAQVRSRMATKYGRSNGSFHRVLACSAGSPGFDSRLRHNILIRPIQKEVDGSGQASTLSCLTKLTVKNMVGDNVEFFILLIVYI